MALSPSPLPCPDRVGILSWIDSLRDTVGVLDVRDLCRRCILGGYSYDDFRLFATYASASNLLDACDLDSISFVARSPEDDL